MRTLAHRRLAVVLADPVADRYRFGALRAVLDTWPDPSTRDDAIRSAVEAIRSWPIESKKIEILLEGGTPCNLWDVAESPSWSLVEDIAGITVQDAEVIFENFGAASIRSLSVHVQDSRDLTRLIHLPAFQSLSRLSLTISHPFPPERLHLFLLLCLPSTLKELSLNILPTELLDPVLRAVGRDCLKNLDRLELTSYSPSVSELPGLAEVLPPSVALAMGSNADFVRRISDSPNLSRRISKLTFTGPDGDEVAKELARAVLPQLRSLAMPTCGLSPKGISSIRASDWALGLRELNVRGNPLGDDGWAALSAGCLRDLESLDAGETGCSPSGVRLLCDSDSRKLRSLNLAHNKIADDGCRVLAQWDGSSSLNSLNLRCNEIGDSGLAAFSNGRWDDLQCLDLTGMKVAPDSVASLTRCRMTKLRELNLNWTWFENEHVEALARAESWCELRSLDLGLTGIGSRGWQAIASASWRHPLSVLSIDSRADDACLLALARSDGFENLLEFRIPNTAGCSREAMHALAIAPMMRMLEHIHLDYMTPRADCDFWLSVDDLRPLAKSSIVWHIRERFRDE